ncbi:peptidoglycan-binding domain-containing protein [Leptolyngbya sp. FACHB-711]|jgi:peptidoglycan hydrolase-like protein with peptidoglycan-binding domain|uniref:peptidoglycan-binding domain-containing protein n=1 Tax=unclassified Leptolyngbya TaxID=2650499 RepID=UPI0016858269|nr:peptidoglycan-binding domain-containing protein [Leptolyngbya sp. FACHB-711]MBD1851647.1 peptidoglycan-binding protein [Cyanobacteria bacterium FACHB-502]MBD2026623.1 peptidoglycan-binding protein [Leptolyngbya sp. FACHB-711]
MVQSVTAQLPTLQNGSRGPAVALLQRLLVLYGYPSIVGAVDGQFGAKTQAAVVQFQKDQNVAVKDGIVGSATWDKLTYPAGTQRP